MNSLLRVLIVEDSPDDTELLVHELQRGGFQLDWQRVETARAMQEAMRSQSWDLILSDHMLPRFSGPKALEIFKESGQDIPFIMVSGVIDMQEAVAIMKAGAHDFVDKGEMSRLIPAIQRELRDAQNRHLKRKAQRALKEANATLEQQVQERTQQLQDTVVRLEAEIVWRKQAETALKESKEAAVAANRAKSVFLANMSHELRTPLNAVLGFSQLMQDDPDIPTAEQENLKIINRSGQYLLTLINAVLDMSKIEAGKLTLETTPIDLGGLVREVIDMMQERAEAKNLQLLLDQSSQFPRYIRADAAKLRQVLINLLSNAVKYTLEGGISVRLGVEPDKEITQEGSQDDLQRDTRLNLLFEIEDSGIGIAPEGLQHIFQPFVQVGGSGEQTGTGLGLAITRQYVELMGGEVDVESVLGKGSVFRVRLPVEQLSEGEMVEAEPSLGRVLKLAPGQAEYRILIAEDSQDSRLLLRKLLEKTGFTVREALQGKEAVSIFEEWHPHLIWMDRRMPVMDGLEATRRIRLMEGGKETVIVALTASVFKEQMNEVMEAGSDDFVRKPFKVEEIFSCMAKHLGVRYIREEDAGVSSEALPELEIKAETIASLPKELLSDLNKAIDFLDIELTLEVIARIEAVDQALASALRQRVERLDFDSLQKLMKNQG